MSRKIVFAALLCFGSVLFAQEAPPPLTVVVGAGSVTAPTYPGSDEYRSLPLPLIDLSYAAGNVVLFASTPEGIGVKVAAPAGFYLKGFAGIGSLVYAESALGDAAAWPIQGLIRHFRPEIERRINEKQGGAAPMMEAAE